MKKSHPVELIINGKFLLASLEGMPRVGREITAQFDKLVEEDRFAHLKVRILAPRGARGAASFKNIEIQEVGRHQGIVWEQLDFPYYLGNRYSINFTGTAPVLRRNGCLVVHDAQFFSSRSSHSWKSFLLYGLITPFVARSYKNIVTDSKFAKREIFDYRVSRRNDIAVIPLGADHVLQRSCDDSILTEYSLSRRSFLLTNSYIHTHKNVRTIFEAIKDSPYLCSKLVLFGSSTRKDYEKRGIYVPPGVVFTGRISDDHLVSLMTNARMFLFPSLTEGFGLPPLEAMSLGCPTICADAGAMPEVCGDGALYASAQDPLDWREKIDYIWNDDEVQRRLSNAARLQSSRYTWRQAAVSYLDLICGGPLVRAE